MSLRYYMREKNESSYLDISDRCRKTRLDVVQKAEEGAVGMSTLVIDDPDGDLDIGGWHVFYIVEDEYEDPDQQCIYVGHSNDRAQIKRGPYTTGAGREWHVTLSDVNNMLYRRILIGSDNDRPSESDNTRIGWVLTTDEGEEIGDTRYVTSDNPWALSENDFLGQETFAVYSDAANQSGKNFFVTHFGDVGTYPFGDYSLFYEKPEELVYVSAARLTNVLADIAPNDDPPIFYVTREPVEFTVDWSRIGWRAYVPYNDQYVTASLQSTADIYNYRDLAYPAVNVNTAAVAQARANRYVRDAATPDHRATIQFYTPREKVNAIREGMLVEVKMSHWPEPYRSEYVYMRVLSRQITDVSDESEYAYLQTIEVSRSEPGPPAEEASAILYRSAGPYDGLVWWDASGDNPEAGLPEAPTTGMLDILIDMGGPTGANRPYYAIKVTGTGTVDVEFFGSTTGVLVDDINYTITYAIRVNGSVVASESVVVSGFLEYHQHFQLVTATAVPVLPDDEITASISTVPASMPFFRTPAGAGQNGERLKITGGSLA
jgi:hypothetical protein